MTSNSVERCDPIAPSMLPPRNNNHPRGDAGLLGISLEIRQVPTPHRYPTTSDSVDSYTGMNAHSDGRVFQNSPVNIRIFRPFAAKHTIARRCAYPSVSKQREIASVCADDEEAEKCPIAAHSKEQTRHSSI
jgi:hypothetical protein